jgi:prepilin-type N-terminal cleavage/methylation domain-containing protein
MKTQGFTLIELMIILAIIAVITSIAVPGLIRSRMAANEASAVSICKVYASAQELYRRCDYNRDGTLEYAQHLSGANSLYEITAGMGDVGLVEKAIAQAEGDPLLVNAKAGYVFKVLTGQGIAMAGGSKSYMSGTHMISGYGLSAIPNQYDNTGRNTFIISSAATVYGKDRGTGTTGHEDVFNADGSWIMAQ